MTGDAWTHPNSKEWTITFEMAQAYGWQPPLRTRSHPNYILECPIRDPRCKIRAYGTSNADEPARTARRKIRQCQHVPEVLFRQARRHVAEGEQLIKIVEAQVLVETSRAEVEVYISDLESTIDAADAKIEAFVEADDRHKRLEEELRLIVSDRGRMGELRDNQSKAKGELSKARKELDSKESAHLCWVDLDRRVNRARMRLRALAKQIKSMELGTEL